MSEAVKATGEVRLLPAQTEPTLRAV